jgi:hypothetical protein
VGRVPSLGFTPQATCLWPFGPFVLRVPLVAIADHAVPLQGKSQMATFTWGVAPGSYAYGRRPKDLCDLRALRDYSLLSCLVRIL